MKKVILLFALLLILAAGVFFAQNYLRSNTINPFQRTPTATINGHTFELSVADSKEEREIGLSETNSLSENQGMIFLFETPEYYPFWMKNMKMPIDIIYINNDSITTIVQDAKPPSNPTENLTIYTPQEPSDKVLEIQAGLSSKLNFKKGDKVTYENLIDRD